MLGFELTGTNAAIAMLVIITVMFIEFIRERHPPEVVAIATAGVMMVLGLLPIKDAGSVLSNAAPWTIAFMFIIMGGLLLDAAAKDERYAKVVSALMARIDRDNDRKAFDGWTPPAATETAALGPVASPAPNGSTEATSQP